MVCLLVWQLHFPLSLSLYKFLRLSLWPFSGFPWEVSGKMGDMGCNKNTKRCSREEGKTSSKFKEFLLTRQHSSIVSNSKHMLSTRALSRTSPFIISNIDCWGCFACRDLSSSLNGIKSYQEKEKLKVKFSITWSESFHFDDENNFFFWVWCLCWDVTRLISFEGQCRSF